MSIESEIFDRLTNFAGLTALISSRVHPVDLPQDVTLPALAYWLVSEDRETAMGSDPGIVRARFQFDIYDRGSGARLSAINVGEQLRAALQRYRTTTGTIIQDTFYMNRSWAFNETREDQILMCDFELIYVE